jgi:cytochrome b561
MSSLRPLARYDAVAMSLHWVIALLILLDFALAMSFSRFDPGDALYLPSAYELHMSVGGCILILSVARVIWRLTHRRPPLPDMLFPLLWLARASHFLLYVFMVVAPVSGWLVLSLRHKTTSVFGLFRWAWPSLPAIAHMGRPERVFWHDHLLPLHIRMSYVGLCLVALHVSAALYHHFGRRDEVLVRMLPSRTLPHAKASLATERATPPMSRGSPP